MVKKTQSIEGKNPTFLAFSHPDWFLPYERHKVFGFVRLLWATKNLNIEIWSQIFARMESFGYWKF